MTIFDVVVNTDDLVVLGPPSTIDVSVDIGQQGIRGATFYAGSGDPNVSGVLPSGISLIAGDLFINTSTAASYGWLYIYNPKVIGNQWDQVLRLQPPAYAGVSSGTFTTGTATFSIPLENIVPSDITIVSEDELIVTITPKGANPIAASIVSKTIDGTNFEFDVTGVSYSGGSWAALSGSVDFAVHISVV